MPKYGARVRFSLAANVNTLFPSNHTRIRAHCPYPGTRSRHCTRALYGTWVFGVPVSERNAVLFRCTGTSPRAPSAETALLTSYFLA